MEGEVGLSHDVLGNLVAVHQPTGHTTTMSYDMAGRKLTMTDPDLGTWHYTYTRRGQLKDQTDACANLTALTYDALDRLRVQTVTAGNNANCRTAPAAGASVNYTYTYDVGQAALGQLTGVRASDGSYTKNLLYDAAGRVRAEGIAIFGSINYTTSYTYDAYQRLVVTTYPGGEKVRMGYNSMGLPETLTSTAVISPLVSSVDYDAAGRPVTLSLASGWLQRTQRYGPWNTSGAQGGQLLGITVTQGSSVVAALGYSYDAFGNVQTRQESGGTPNAFDYDGQHRLVSAYGHSYDYDNAGRMLQFEGGAGFTFDSVHPHAVNTVNSVDRFDYDANGNLIRRNKGLAASQVLTWTADNRLATVQSSTLTERYAYAPDGERIWKETNGAVTRTPFAHYEVDVASNTVTRYYSFGGRLIAMRQGSAQPTYLHTDALGSVVAASPVGGSTSALQRYCGYGRLRSAGSGGAWNCGTAANLFATDRTYTGQQADGTGLMYYHARYYDPAAGQFISPDSLVPDPINVMDYNRYAYARANPLRYSDPSGHYSVEELIQHFGVSSFQELHALFGKDGKYAGNTGWYDILRAAQDGDRITATYANNTLSIQGTFMRNDQGKILINMKGSLFPESEFAHFGGYVPNGKDFGLPSGYGMYHLEGKSENRWATAVSGTQMLTDMPCNTWDCVALGLDATALGGSVLRDVSLATIPATGPVGMVGAATGNFAATGATVAGRFRTIDLAFHGNASALDLVVSETTFYVGAQGNLPFASEVASLTQLIYDLADPIIPDDIR